MPITQLSATELREKIRNSDNLLLLDVREPHEFDYAHIEGSELIPLALLPLRVAELDADRETVLVCHHGVRSMQASNYLQGRGFAKLYNLTGGIDAWSVQCDDSVPRY
ncbi:rhodanese-like domain-containing protein [Methylomarinum sp. Ch1-1]|uniref:Rhodanese-like domain-containing protein n=1 Tax=Methylomarinum roseum TaxID=3067653 RepID=A0AAU7NQ41_9GAMM|nr:rhodanese-like domain-containing protein [Methylomarinum sp. Ch1-1]MDP4520972.1 rhodanese-like domain-containing protein [Methylomarinum sp. Ch1-1]